MVLLKENEPDSAAYRKTRRPNKAAQGILLLAKSQIAVRLGFMVKHS